MNKSFIKSQPHLHALRRLETGFSMLEAVVVVGVLLALAVAGFFAYGPITENAKKAKVKSAASEIYTGVMVADSDGDSTTKPQDVIDKWNASTDDIHVEILDPVTGGTSANGDFCVSATNVKSPYITARMGTCDGVTGGGVLPGGDPIETPSAGIMRTTWDTSIVPMMPGDTCDAITLPLTGTVDATIDWGDGTKDRVTTAYPTHTYTNTKGIQNVSIDGTFTGWVGFGLDAFSRMEMPPSWSLECLTKVTEWGETGTTNAKGGFFGTQNLTEVASLPSTVTDFSALFMASTFNGNLNGWNTSKVTGMSGMFLMSEFNQSLNGWDTSKVTDMNSMFDSNSAFNGDISSWDTSNVTSMDNMFRKGRNGSVFNQPLNWNTSKVTSMDGMFSGAAAFNQSLNWNTSNVQNMSSMFSGATAFNGNISGWSTSKVEQMDRMFMDATSFNGDISDWNTSNVQNMNSMFYNAAVFNGDVSRWNTSKVEQMGTMFGYAPVFNGNVSGWDTSNVTAMDGMFSGAAAFNQDINGWNTSKVASMGSMFYDAIAFDQPLDRWDVRQVVDMSSMFSYAAAFNHDLSGWSTDNVLYAYDFSVGSGLSAEHMPTWVNPVE